MKPITYLLLLILLSCNTKPADTGRKTEAISSAASSNPDNSKYHTQLDSIVIIITSEDSFRLSKAEFNSIVDDHPEFFNEIPEDPEFTWHSASKKNGLGSEVGQDFYYQMYAYFLRQRNGDKEFTQQRQKLIDIYSGINSLFGRMWHGGTFFGHQYPRIQGYAEYSIFLLKNRVSDQKTYDFTKQKALYIRSLHQLVSDESRIDFDILGKDKEKLYSEIHGIVDMLDTLITDKFYLKRAQEFQYRHYESY